MLQGRKKNETEYQLKGKIFPVTLEEGGPPTMLCGHAYCRLFGIPGKSYDTMKREYQSHGMEAASLHRLTGKIK